MSHGAFNKQWADAQASIDDLLEVELPKEPAKPERDRIVAFQFLAVMYVKYIQIFRKLEECYDQVVHPQKRRILRHVLDGTMGRILELKNEMVLLEYSEYHYLDDVLSDLKLTPNDIEIPIPKYFIRENSQAIKERDKMMGTILAGMKETQAPSQSTEEVQITSEDAIRLIQIHERARQGRLRAKFMREIRAQEERERLAATRGAPTIDRDLAATQIQKVWKGYSTRKKTAMEREEELVFVGMKSPKEIPFKETQKHASNEVKEHRRVVQEEYERDYQKALNTVKEKLTEIEGPEMKEQMQDQIRQWFIECRDATGKFPEYPTEDEGGSAAIFTQKDPAQVEEELRKKEEEKGKKKGKKDKKRQKGKERQKGWKERKERKGRRG